MLRWRLGLARYLKGQPIRLMARVLAPSEETPERGRGGGEEGAAAGPPGAELYAWDFEMWHAKVSPPRHRGVAHQAAMSLLRVNEARAR